MKSFFPIAVKDGIVGHITNALVVPIRASGCTFIDHAALSHNAAGIGVVGIMSGGNAVHADFLKEMPDHGG